MADLEVSLKRLLNKCPDITLSADDVQDIIDNGINGVIRRYKGVPEPEVEEVIEKVVEEIEEFDEEISPEEEVRTHIEECDDEFCECKSVFDEIEEE